MLLRLRVALREVERHVHPNLFANLPSAFESPIKQVCAGKPDGSSGAVAAAAAAAQAEKLAQLKAEEAEMQKKEAEGERKQKEREEADARSRQLRGDV